MVQGQLDREDLVWSPLFVFGSLYESGLVERAIGGFDPLETLITIGSVDISYAAAASIVALAVVFYQRDSPVQSIEGALETWVVLITLGLVLLQPFVPTVEEFIQSEPIVGTIAFILQLAGFTLVVYKN